MTLASNDSNEQGPDDGSRTVCLELGGKSLQVQIRREGAVRSAHSGRPLVELHGWVTTGDPEQHQWISSALRSIVDRSVRSTDEMGDFAGNWLVSWNSYVEAAGLHTYSLILLEKEELSLEALLLGDLELHPYEYRERVIGDGLIIWAKLVGTPEDLDRLRGPVRSREAIPVVRRGIQSEPRLMRLGVAEWSVFEDRIKYRIVLVDADVSDGARSEIARIEEENTRVALGYYENFVERLTDLLVQRGVLAEAEVSALRETSRTAPGATRRDLWRVHDVDALV